jgi:hypothetical protein
MNVKKAEDFVKGKITADFMDMINKIRDEDIRDFVNDALANAPDEFWDAKSSTTGNNHPPENNLEKIGLLIHIIKAMAVAETLFHFFGVDPMSIDADIVRASILVHDLYKQGNPWTDEHCKEHGRICADILEQYTLKNEYAKKKIKQCVATHMSRWTYPMEDLKDFFYPDRLQLIVALSDYHSSRNEISFYPYICVLGDKYDNNMHKN